MLERLKTYIQKEDLWQGDMRILVALSGGLDSMCLCHLLHQLEVDFGVAHCNFQLRGEESDLDAEFVANFAESLGVDIFIRNFNIKKIINEEKGNIQNLARKLRYAWFDELLLEKDYDIVATAHHKNDWVETQLYKLSKGTGIRGLRSILPKRGKIVRPLLAFTKKEILAYAQKHNIKYREDSSNIKTDYQRNFIRHKIIPQLEQLNPKLIESMSNSSSYLRDLELILEEKVSLIKNQYLTHNQYYSTLDFDKFRNEKAVSTILFELLRVYGFNSEQVQQIEASYPSNGKLFYSDTHELFIHQKQLLIQKITTNPFESTWLKENKLNPYIKMELVSRANVNFSDTKNIAYLDYDKLKFPLLLRTWKAGDYYCPLGMQGKRQKVQDFFSNAKMSLFEKRKTLFLESDENICWIVGHRIDERFKIDDSTQRILKLVFEA